MEPVIRGVLGVLPTAAPATAAAAVPGAGFTDTSWPSVLSMISATVVDDAAVVADVDVVAAAVAAAVVEVDVEDGVVVDVGVAGGSIKRFDGSRIHGGSSLSPRSL